MTATDSETLGAWVQVAEVGHRWQGELIVGRLRASGIDAELVDQTFHQEPVPNIRSFAIVRVLVPAEQEDDANRVLVEVSERSHKTDTARDEDQQD